jgi:hypothetical protein
MPTKPATNIFKDIKRHVPMEALLTVLGAEFPSWNGWTEWRSVFCPFHGDHRKPSGRFTETEDEDGNPTGHFQCFNSACGIKGDQIEILVASGIVGDVREAIRWLRKHFDVPTERSLRSVPNLAFPGDLPPTWYEGKPTLEEWDAPWPTRFSPPSDGWTEDQWALVIGRWMHPANEAVERSKRFNGVLVRNELDRVGTLSRDELQAVIRKSISHALLTYDPETHGARFSTFLHTVVRHDVIDAVRKEERSRKGLVEDNGQDRRDQGPEGRESFWASLADFHYAFEWVRLRMGPEYARLMADRVNGCTQQEHATLEGISLREVKYREKELRLLLKKERVVGRETVMYREEVQRKYGNQGTQGPTEA